MNICTFFYVLQNITLTLKLLLCQAHDSWDQF